MTQTRDDSMDGRRPHEKIVATWMANKSLGQGKAVAVIGIGKARVPGA